MSESPPDWVSDEEMADAVRQVAADPRAAKQLVRVVGEGGILFRVDQMAHLLEALHRHGSSDVARRCARALIRGGPQELLTPESAVVLSRYMDFEPALQEVAAPDWRLAENREGRVPRHRLIGYAPVLHQAGRVQELDLALSAFKDEIPHALYWWAIRDQRPASDLQRIYAKVIQAGVAPEAIVGRYFRIGLSRPDIRTILLDLAGGGAKIRDTFGEFARHPARYFLDYSISERLQATRVLDDVRATLEQRQAAAAAVLHYPTMAPP